jgi:putative Holliday junction resolvase
MSGSSESKADEEPADQGRSFQRKTPPLAEGDRVPRRGRLMGLDFGTRRIGIALCDEDQRIASPLENYSRLRPEADALRLKTLAGEYRAVGLVVGLPLHMGGEEGQKAREARRFGAWAATATALPLVFWDERLTSALAEEYLRSAQLSPKKRKLRLDMVAAQIMLQSFLESRESRDR